MDWEQHAEREEARYQDGWQRLPEEPEPRQKQLVRIAMAAGGAGLARLMQGRLAEAAGWFARSAERYRESYEQAPPESWGRLIGAVKARVLAGDWAGAETDARWALDQRPDESGSPIGRYAAALASLVVGEDERATELAAGLARESEETFPRPVAEALAGLASRDAECYASGLAEILTSFETREEYLEDIPVADTVLVLEAIAERRGIPVRPRSALLPSPRLESV